MAVTKKGARWYVVLDLGRTTGRRKQKWLPGSYKTKREAIAAETEARNKLNKGLWVEPTKVTFGEYLIDWLPRIVEPNVEFSTFDSYRRNIENHVLPAVGHVQLRKLTSDHLINLYSDLRDKKLKSKTVHYIHTIIHRALADAFDQDKIERNVAAKRTVRPKIRRQDSPKKVAWTREQLGLFLEQTSDHRFYLPWLIGMLTGLRRGEVLGLKWQALDLNHGTAKIEHQITVVANRVIAKDVVKTSASGASIPLPLAVVDLLKALRATEKTKKFALGLGGLHDGDYVFTDDSFKFIHPQSFSQAFERVVRRSDLPRIPLHGLRTTYISLSSAAGTPLKIVQANARHSSISTTMDTYAMPYEDLQRAANEQLADYILGESDNQS